MHVHSKTRRPLGHARGFTLIELLVVVAIVGILAAVALPAYQRQVQRGRRVDAKGAVLDMAARQERFFAMNNKFSNTASDLGYATLPWAVVSSGGNSYYQLSASIDPTAQTFTARATPTGTQTQDTDCYAYVVDQAGNKYNQSASLQPLSGSNCW